MVMKMKKIFLISLLLYSTLIAQSFEVANVKGNVKAQFGFEEKWVSVKPGDMLDSKAMVMTEENSSVRLKTDDLNFILKENSALELGKLKKLTTDELVLALAMEQIINAPANKKNNSENTAVYGSNENGKQSSVMENNNFGIKKLNGAMQLVENGFDESAVISARETFRKYPKTALLPKYRLYFANILFKKKLYDEAYSEYKAIESLDLNKEQKIETNKMLAELGKKLLKN